MMKGVNLYFDKVVYNRCRAVEFYEGRKGGRMAFDDETIAAAWGRSGGRCECERATHGHVGRCGKMLAENNRGRESGWGSWEAHHRLSVQSGGSDALSNCEVLCWDCHSRTI